MRNPVAISGFSGVAPRSGPRALRPDQAQIAHDARLTSGELEALRAPLLVATLLSMPGPAKTAFKSTATAGSRWLAWHTDVDAVRGLVPSDRTGLVYFTGNGVPQWTNYALAGQNGYPLATRTLGVPAPPSAPTVTFTSGSGSVKTRAIRYSLVLTSADGWDQESEASPAVVASGYDLGTWQISGLQVAPSNTYAITTSTWVAGVLTITTPSTFGLRVGDSVTHGTAGTLVVTSVSTGTFAAALPLNPGVLAGSFSRVAPYDTSTTKWRIYWSEADGSYKQVGDYPTSTALPISISATTSGTALEPLTDAPMPPVDLISLCRHPSGALVGLSGNQLCASEPYKPYSWPLRYRTPLAFDPVACRVFGRTVVIGTKGVPAIYTGTDPSTFAPDEVTVQWPCLSARGMIATQDGVGYPSPYGLVWIGVNGPSLLTLPSYAKRDWEVLNPDTFRAAPYGASYVALHDGTEASELWWFQPIEPAAITTATGSDVTGLVADPETGALMLLTGDAISEWDADPALRRTYIWRSKEFTLNPPGAPAAYWPVVEADMTPAESAALEAARALVIAANMAVSATANRSRGALGMRFFGGLPMAGSLLDPVPSAAFDELTINTYVNDTLVDSQSVTGSGPNKLTPLTREDNVTFEFVGNMRVRLFSAHGSAEALQQALSAQ